MERHSTKKRTLASGAAARVVQLAMDPDCTAQALGALAASDVAFGMRVLQMVNSPAFQLSRKVDSVPQAVALLGVRGMKNLALSMIVLDMMPRGEVARVLFANTLRRALAARMLAEALGDAHVDAYFTAGLFLEAGLLLHVCDAPERTHTIASGAATMRTVLERAAGLQPHPQLGAELARDYHLPDEVAEAIAHHHDPQPPSSSRMAQVCWVAERLAGAFEGGDLHSARADARAAARTIGLDEATIDAIAEALPVRVQESADAFHQQIDEQLDLETLALDAHRALIQSNEQLEGLVRELERVVAEKERLEAELRLANARLSAEATTDALTGLANKRALTTALERDLARSAREGQTLSLVVVDVDRFKKFNDTWGHAVGDEVLRVLGTVLADSVREGDLAARYGGEEFVLLLPNTPPADAFRVAERVRRAVETTPVRGPKGPLRVTASFGVSAVAGNRCIGAAESLFEQADTALYDAKKGGRNRVCVARALLKRSA